MHVQIINFSLEGVSEEEYRNQIGQIAPAFAGLPGLVSKTWLANPETNTYGGVYAWRDREAMEAYKETDLYRGMLANPHFEGVTDRDFTVLEGPTRTTRGMAGISTPASRGRDGALPQRSGVVEAAGREVPAQGQEQASRPHAGSHSAGRA